MHSFHSAYPTAPVNVTFANISDTLLSLNWLPPVDTGGSDIYYYVINISSNDDSDFKCIEEQCKVNTNSSTITGLKHAVIYNISISTVNCIGVGESSSTVQLRTGTYK